AYLTMIGKGALAASEIAYYANLPRTKIYQTLKKLEKKKLAIISKHKPLVCSAVAPEEAFGEIISLHDKRLRNMKKMVEDLQKACDNAQRPKGSEEHRYFALDAEYTLTKVSDLIAHSKSSVSAALDRWGIRLISQCKPSLVRALTNGVHARLLIAPECIGGEHLTCLPDGIELRTANVSSNLITIDSVKMMSVDSNNGKAALYGAGDPFGAAQLRQFEQEWSTSAEVRFLLNTRPAIAANALQMVRAIENGLSTKMLECAISGRDCSVEIMELLETKYGLKISSLTQ